MKINGKDIHFEYTIGAFCDYSDYCAQNTEVSLARASMYKALYMNRAYAEMHEGADTVTIEEIMRLPMDDYPVMLAEVKAAEDAGKKQTVETVEKKQEESKK